MHGWLCFREVYAAVDTLVTEWRHNAGVGAQQREGGSPGPGPGAALLSVCVFPAVGVCLLTVTARHVSKPPVHASLGPSLQCSKSNVNLD